MRFRHILFSLALFTFLSATAGPRFSLKTIVIDAGHGGKDPGTIGYGKTYEKDVALAVALKLGDYIQKNYPDVKIVYTRKTDVFIELHERADIANRVKADLFIAIHCNSSPNPDIYGTSSYILGLHRTEANLEVAKRENAVINLEENQDKNYDFNPNTPEGHIIMSMKQNAFLDQSIDFAAKIENELESFANRKSLGVKQAGFYVLYKTTMPSLLAEIGFISNPEEEKYLNSSRGQDQVASGLFNAFRDYKTEMEGGETEAKTTKKDSDNTPAPPVKKETSAIAKTTTAPVVKEPVKTVVQETVKEPVKEEAKIIEPPVVKEIAKDTPQPAAVKTDSDIVTLTDGTKIKKPLETGGGGGKTTVTAQVTTAKTPVAPVEIKDSKETTANNTTKTTVTKQPAQNNTETKTVAVEKTNPVAAKTEVKVAPVVKSPEVVPATTASSAVISNRHPLVPLMQIESGTVLRIQLFALKGPLKDYDKFIKLFKVMCAEELGNGITRYYGAKTSSMAEAKKYHDAAVSNGYKDSYIVGFKDGKRMSSDEMKAIEGK